MYYAKIIWFDEVQEEEKMDYVFITAGSWNEAMIKINNEFVNISALDIHQVEPEEVNVIYTPKEYIDSIIHENSW